MLQKSISTFASYLQESKKYIWIFLFSQLFPACFYVISKKMQGIYGESVVVEFVYVAIYTIIFLLIFVAIGYIAKYFFGKGYKKVLIILIILNFIGNGLELFVFMNFGTSMTEEMIPVLLETNKNEAFEFIDLYLNLKLIFVMIYFAVGILMSLEIKRQVFWTGLILGIIGIYAGLNFFNLPTAAYVQKNHIYARMLLSYNSYKKNSEETKRLMATFDERFKDVKVLDSIPEATYVLIIGESFSRNHSQLFGYPRETSPKLQQRYEEGNLFKFNDVVSPHHYTRDAVMKLISEYAYDSNKNFAETMNMVSLFKKAGYKTYWLSNQDNSYGEAKGLGLVINRADIIEFTDSDDADKKNVSGADDGALLPLLDKALAENNKKKFIVIHLYGSHVDYKQRYPKEFDYFDDNAEENYFSDLQKKNKRRVNEYHNALRFNDYIVDRIIQNVDEHSKNSFVMYLSDHGEVVYDDDIDHCGHAKFFMKTVEIPMMVWASKYYRENNGEKIERIKAAENTPFDSEDVIYSIIDLANLKYDGYKSDRNLFDQHFKERPRQVHADGTIYKK